MTDAAFVIASYAIVVGSIVAYALSLRRRSSAATRDERAIERRLDGR